MRLRTLLWLIALAAFALPPTFASKASAAAHGTMDMTADMTAALTAAPTGAIAAMPDCPEHAPPPDPCPDQGTARHAAGDCCPLMSGVVALLPDAAAAGTRVTMRQGYAAALNSHLTGRFFTKDPPPPRA